LALADREAIMATDQILTASTIITMDENAPRATAVAVKADGTIAAVGDVAVCKAALPDAAVADLGDTALLPGFVESHSHPVLSGIMTQEPAYWIAPYVGYPKWIDVTDLFTRLQKEQPAGKTLLFNGLDRLLQGCSAPDAKVLDEFFPDRPVLIADNSGHAVYLNTEAIKKLGWDTTPPTDPVGGSFARNADGSLTGIAYEIPAMMEAVLPLLGEVLKNPLASAAQWYSLMAGNGITSTSEMTYNDSLKSAFEAMAALPSCPLRISLYHVSTDDACGEQFESKIPASMLTKRGIKLWADGSPWVGNVALTFPYLDTEVTRAAGIKPGTPGIEVMNYSRAQLDVILDKYAPQGWQMAFHVNGDAALDVVLDAYEAALTKFNLLGTDHRWRIVAPWCGSCRSIRSRRKTWCVCVNGPVSVPVLGRSSRWSGVRPRTWCRVVSREGRNECGTSSLVSQRWLGHSAITAGKYQDLRHSNNQFRC